MPPPSASAPTVGGHERRRARAAPGRPSARRLRRSTSPNADEQHQRRDQQAEPRAGRTRTRASVSPLTSSVIAATSRPRPGRSSRRAVSADDSGSPRRLGSTRARHGDARRRRTTRASRCRRRRAPRRGRPPAAIPTPTLAPQTAEKRPRSCGSAAAWASTARPQASTAAPPTPSRVRAATNRRGARRDRAAHGAEPHQQQPGEVDPASAERVTERRPRAAAPPPGRGSSSSASRPVPPGPAPRSATVCGVVATGVT